MNKKLTATEIIDIIKKNGISVSDFGYNEIYPPDDFQFSAIVQQEIEVEKQLKEKANAYKLLHPTCTAWDKQQTEEAKKYQELNRTWLTKSSEVYQLKKTEYFDFLDLGEIKEVEQHGGEGEGTLWYSVKYFPDHDVYIKTTGTYSSYEGTEFYDGYGEEVKPITKTITVYE